MKPNHSEREILAERIRRARVGNALSNAKLAALAKIDPGQASRILDGKFRTLSDSVMQICNVLGVDPHAAAATDPSDASQVRSNAAWAKLEASVRRAWDKTPQGADRLARVIDAIAQVGGR